ISRPIGVPVVRPSNTPERMRTASASWRWLTNFEVPVRRRSISACRSASLSSSPGGHPSTMQPSAGPWLSPKLVTVKSLPKVFPDMFLSLSLRSELRGREHEYAIAPAFKGQPGEWQTSKRASHRGFRVAHFHDENASGIQMPPGVLEDHPYRVHAILACGQGPAWLVAIFRWQRMQLAPPHIGRVADNDIVALVVQGAKVIRFKQADAPAKPVLTHIVGRQRQGLRADIE